jgi:CHAT domain-containing protein/Flp pilus assembly protein TadD
MGKKNIAILVCLYSVLLTGCFSALLQATLDKDREEIYRLLNDEIKVKSGNLKSADMFRAVINRQYEKLQQALQEGADPNDELIQTTDALYNQYSPLMFAAWSGDLSAAALLIKKGANINHATYYKSTPLTTAALGGHAGVLQLLINKGAVINPPVKKHKSTMFSPHAPMTPLTTAVFEGHQAAASLLLKNKADRYYSLLQLELNLNRLDRDVDHDHWVLANVIKQNRQAIKMLGELDKKLSLVHYENFYIPMHPMDESPESNREKHDQALALNDRGIELNQAGNHIEAIKQFNQALSLFIETLGPAHLNVANCMNNLGNSYSELGDFEQAEAFLKKALAITKNARGSNHIDLYESLNNLADMYQQVDNFDQMALYLESVLQVVQSQSVIDEDKLARVLNNQGILYWEIADYQKAIDLFNRSLALRKKIFGDKHIEVAGVLANLGLVHHSLEDYDKSESYYLKAIPIIEKEKGVNHPMLALNLNNLSVLYWQTNRYQETEALMLRSFNIFKEKLGTKHPYVGQLMVNLGRLYHAQGNDKQAEFYYNNALEFLAAGTSKMHPAAAEAYVGSAWLAVNQQRTEDAHVYFMKSERISRHLINQVLSFTSENQKLKFLGQKKSELDAFLTFTMLSHQKMPEITKDAMIVWLERKGMLLEMQRSFQASLQVTDNQEIKSLFKLLNQQRELLSKKYFAQTPIEPSDTSDSVTDIENRINQLESKLSRLSPQLKRHKLLKNLSTEKLLSVLPENAVLVDIAKIRWFNFQAKNSKEYWEPDRYLVFILDPKSQQSTKIINLGPSEVIDRTITEFLSIMEDPFEFDEESVVPITKKLYHLIFKPIEELIGSTERIFLAPDGNLNLLPFEVMQNDKGEYLIQKYTFNYLTSGRDLMLFSENQEQTTRQTAILFGDPDFDLEIDSSNGNRSSQNQSTTLRGIDRLKLHFNRLPGTRVETIAIRQILGEAVVELFLDQKARETHLYRKKSPSILHFATHGYFLDDLKLEANNSLTGRNIILSPQKTRPKNYNPLLRSGLALAGANQLGKNLQSGSLEGLLTADKVMSLSLGNTELVVLSACQTGVGEVQNGEGVYGLRRAFMQAGAKSLVMSLWSVPDEETKELMIRFYQNLFIQKMPRNKALRSAILSQIEIVKNRYGHTHPSYWGAFIFLGKP